MYEGWKLLKKMNWKEYWMSCFHCIWKIMPTVYIVYTCLFSQALLANLERNVLGLDLIGYNLYSIFQTLTQKNFFCSVSFLSVDVFDCLTSLKLILWCFSELLLLMEAGFDQCLLFVFVLSAAMQQVLDNLTDLPTSTGAEEIDLIFLKGIMENPIVRSLAKVIKFTALSRIWKCFNSYIIVWALSMDWGINNMLAYPIKRLEGELKVKIWYSVISVHPG